MTYNSECPVSQEASGKKSAPYRDKVHAMSDEQKSRIEASKAAGRAANYEGNVPHSAVAGRNDAAWESVTSGAGGGGARGGRRASLAAKDLRNDLDMQQLNTFTRWWNSWLSEVNIKVKDLCEEIKPGVISIKLLEVLSDSSCGKVSHDSGGLLNDFSARGLVPTSRSLLLASPCSTTKSPSGSSCSSRITTSSLPNSRPSPSSS